MEVTPIFVGGCSRSGTTMLGSMLGNHPDSIVTPEAQFVSDVFWTTAGSGLFDPVMAWRAIRNHWRFKLWGLDLALLERSSIDQCRSLAELLALIVQHYGAAHGKSDARLWINHTPSSLRYSARLLELFPSAKFIHIIRDGRGVAASVLRLQWGPSTAREAAHWWIHELGPCLAAELTLPSEKIVRVKYEDILADAAKVLQALCEFLGISYSATIVEPTALRVPEYTRQQHALVGGPIIPARADAWRGQLSDRQVEIFEYESFDMLKLLGYQPLYGVSPRGPTFVERRVLGVVEVFRKHIAQRHAGYARILWRKLVQR